MSFVVGERGVGVRGDVAPSEPESGVAVELLVGGARGHGSSPWSGR